MTHGSLFSGIGGFDLASEWMGWQNVFHCEINPFCRKILHHYWPNATSYENILTTDFTIWRGKIGILSGGFPCQPFSTAGSRKGVDDSRYLWPEMLRAIREIRPNWIVGENVYGLVNWSGGLVFDTVCADLENEGFKVIPVVLPAASVNAPHKRFRIFFIAHTHNKGGSNGLGQVQEENGKVSERYNHGKVWDASDSESKRLSSQQARSTKFQSQTQAPLYGGGSDGQVSEFVSPNTDHDGLQGRIFTREDDIKGWDRQIKSSEITSNSDWRIPPTQWESFPTQSPVCHGDDGLPTVLDSITFSKWRNESIKGGGNAIVPPLVLQIFKTIQAMEDDYKGMFLSEWIGDKIKTSP